MIILYLGNILIVEIFLSKHNLHFKIVFKNQTLGII